MLSLFFPAEIQDRLSRLAKASGRTEGELVIEAVHDHLQDLEDLYLSEERLTALREGRSDTVPLQKVMEDYGLDD